MNVRRLSILTCGIGILLSSIIISGGTVGCNTAEESSGSTLVLKVAHFMPADTPYAVTYCDNLLDMVTERTEGHIRFEVYPAQQLFGVEDTLEMVGAGAADIGFTITAYHAGKVPLCTGLELPFAYYTMEEQVYKLREALPLLIEELEKFNCTSIGFVASTFTQIFTVDKAVTGIEDLEGLIIRGPGGYSTMALNSLGAATVSFPVSDIYLALQKGTMDGIATSTISVSSYKLGELIKHATLVAYATHNGPIVFNLDTWNSLSEEMQRIFIEAAHDNAYETIATFAGLEDKILDGLREDYNIEVHTLSREERERWKAATAEVWDQWLADRVTEGLGNPARQLIAILKKSTE